MGCRMAGQRGRGNPTSIFLSKKEVWWCLTVNQMQTKNFPQDHMRDGLIGLLRVTKLAYKA